MADYKEFLDKIYRENRISQKSGNSYQVLIVVFKNGYKFEAFLSNEQQIVMQYAGVPVING